jgi:N-acetylglucosamine kinase-like BadF-type ATPase
MILVADSGSTKCDWLIADGNDQIPTKTMGFNPFFHARSLIEAEIARNDVLMQHKDNIEAVYYYGAGCSSPERNKILQSALATHFGNATDWIVAQDLNGAAHATCARGEKGIACILGTGSNSCYYDGENVNEEVHALGYILGDEGSGSYFGRKMLSEFLYKRMPTELAQEFGETYQLTRENIFYHTYNQPNVNVYLASFMKFVSGHKQHSYFQEMVYNGLAHFADIHITCFQNFKEVPVHFVGSVAYHFQDILNRVAEDMGFTVGKVVKKPIVPLAEYHLRALVK